LDLDLGFDLKTLKASCFAHQRLCARIFSFMLGAILSGAGRLLSDSRRGAEGWIWSGFVLKTKSFLLRASAALREDFLLHAWSEI
jgi:hypothetical protein